MQFDQLKRRDFITLLGGAAAAWPRAARAQQQPERMRRIAILLPAAAGDSAFQTPVGAFMQGLQQLGWFNGHNVSIDTRWATANAAEIRRHAAELVALAPDVILAHATPTVGPLLQVPAPCRSCFRLSSIRSAPASSKASRVWGEMPPVLRRLNMA
jgi:putative tryptophan/tyrosine transport system substrate-binding protein